MCWAWLPFCIFVALVVVFTSNAVNLTDGLDGLAIGLMVIAAGALTILTYAGGHVQLAEYLQLARNPRTSELTIFCGSMTGASLGFLWYNAHPAEIFMGDVGSLGLGGAMAVVAVLIKQEVLLLFIGGVFMLEARLGDPAGGQLQAAQRQAHFQDGAAAPSFRGAGLDGIEDHRALLDRRAGAGAVRADDVEVAMTTFQPISLQLRRGTRWSAADALAGLVESCIRSRQRVQGDPRGPRGPPTQVMELKGVKAAGGA